jgi:acyl-phosphate glycerol 3-phosphate acyltransferase
MKIALFALASYLYGAIPFAYLATWLLTGKKLTEEGTGNIGVTNSYKIGGIGAVIITLMGEISKAALPIYAARSLFGDDLFCMLLAAFSALVGTSFSLFLRGRGGKGSTVAIWTILILSPLAGVTLLATWGILALWARKTIIVKKLQLVCIPGVIYLVERDPVFTAFGVLASLLFLLTGYIRKDDFAYYNIFQQRAGAKDADSLHP